MTTDPNYNVRREILKLESMVAINPTGVISSADEILSNPGKLSDYEQAYVLRVKGLASRLLMNLDLAEISYEKAVSVLPPTQNYLGVKLAIDLGLIHRMNGHLKKAVSQYEAALSMSLYDERHVVLNNVAAIHILRLDFFTAISILQEALAIVPKSKAQNIQTIKINLAKCYFRNDELELGGNIIEDVFSTPNLSLFSRISAELAVGLSLLRKEKFQHALEVFMKASDEASKHSLLLLQKRLTFYIHVSRYAVNESPIDWDSCNEIIKNKIPANRTLNRLELIRLLERKGKFKQAHKEGLSLKEDIRKINSKLEVSHITKLEVMAWERQKLIALQEEERERSEAIAEATIQTLQAQMNPHFLFNALSAVSGLIATGQSNKSLDYLSRFGRLLRISVDSTGKKFVPIFDEVQMAKDYMELELLRKPGLFEYKISLSSITKEDLMLPMILQPLVENSIKHGISSSKKKGKIEIVIEKEGKRAMAINVKDNGNWKSKSNSEIKAGLGIGIENIKNRVITYGKSVCHENTDVVFDIFPYQRGTVILIKMPIQNH